MFAAATYHVLVRLLNLQPMEIARLYWHIILKMGTMAKLRWMLPLKYDSNNNQIKRKRCCKLYTASSWSSHWSTV